MKHFCLGLLLVCGLVQLKVDVQAQTLAPSKLLSNAATNTVNTPHVRAEFMAYAPEGVQPGKPLMVGDRKSVV